MPITPPVGDGGGGFDPPILEVSPIGPYAFGNVAVGAHSDLTVTVSNVGGSAGNVSSVTIGGAPYSLIGLPAFPARLEIGGSFSFTLRFTPTVGGTFNDTLTVTAAMNNSPFTAAVSGTAPGGGASVGNGPGIISFPDTVITKTAVPDILEVVTNNGVGAVTVNAIALASGINFSLNTVPALPHTLTNPGDSLSFNVRFTPTVGGSLTDTLNITTTANNPAVPVSGNGVQITPVSILTQNSRQVLWSFVDGSGVVLHKQLDASNSLGLLTSPGALAGTLILNGTIWNSIGNEKVLRRMVVYYENVGVGALTCTVSTWRPSTPGGTIDTFDSKTQSINLGSAAADLTERVGFFDIQMAGEIIVVSFTRPASGGPLSLIGFLPEFEDKGERVAG